MLRCLAGERSSASISLNCLHSPIRLQTTLIAPTTNVCGTDKLDAARSTYTSSIHKPKLTHTTNAPSYFAAQETTCTTIANLMWCYRFRAWQSSPLFLLLSFVIAAGLVVQLKTLYDNHQKHLRIVDYSRSINEMTATVEHVDKVTNRLSVMIKRIESYIDAEKQRGNSTTAIR